METVKRAGRGRPKKQPLVEYGEKAAALDLAYTALLKAVRIVQAQVVGADLSLPAEVYALTENASEGVTVEILNGNIARGLAGEVLADFSIGEDIHRARRLPGLVAVRPATAAALGALNTAKAAFEKAVVALPRGTDGGTRAAILNKVCPQVHLIQACRQVPVLTGAPDWASFIWVSSGTSNRNLTHAEALKMLERHETNYCPRDKNPAGCQAMVARAREILGREPANAQFVQAPPVAPHVRVNLRAGKARFQRHAYLPLFYPVQDGHRLRSFAPGPFQPAAGGLTPRRPRARRSDFKRATEPLVRGLHLYRRLDVDE